METWIVVLVMAVLTESSYGGTAWINADDRLVDVYVDGVRINVGTNYDVWNTASEIPMPADYDVIAIKATNSKGAGGMLFEDRVLDVTSSGEWKCSRFYEENWHTTDFDDENWANATVTDSTNDGNYRGKVTDISVDVSWIWHDQPRYKTCGLFGVICNWNGPKDAYCRYHRKPKAYR